MGNAFIKESTLTAIGDAIRAKTGGTDLMLPGDMATAIESMELGGKSGSYVWTKQGMGDSTTTDSTGGTYTLTTANDSRPSTEIEYSSAAPTYDATKRQWIFAESTVVTLVNSDDVLPSISGNVYVRVTSEPNFWYLVSAFAKGSSSPYTKNMTYSQKITATDDWVKKYLTDVDGEKYPIGWSDGYYYERIVANPNTKDGGKDWTLSNVTSVSFYSVYYGNGIWVAGSNNNKGLWYSTDGKTWTQSNITMNSCLAFYYANGLWVAGVGGFGLFYSTDGKTWTQSNITNMGFDPVYYANGLWVAGSSDDTGLYYSTDGKTWTQSNVKSGYFTSVYYGNGLWVASGDSSKGLWYSTNGKNWTQSNITSDSPGLVYCANGIWVAGGTYYSTDGKSWTQSNLKDLTSYNFSSVYYADGLWIGGVSNSGLWYSTDGKVWTLSNVTSGSFYSVYYGNGIWVAASNDGLYYSTDGKTWTLSNVTSGSFYSVYYGNGIWVAGSNNSKGLYYSEGESVEVDF